MVPVPLIVAVVLAALALPNVAAVDGFALQDEKT